MLLLELLLLVILLLKLLLVNPFAYGNNYASTAGADGTPGCTASLNDACETVGNNTENAALGTYAGNISFNLLWNCYGN